MATLSKDIADLTAASAPMSTLMRKVAELGVLAADVDAMRKLPPRRAGETPEDLGTNIASGRIQDMAHHRWDEGYRRGRSGGAR